MTPAEPIAVIGSACRFPGEVNTPSKLWNLLLEPKDLQSEVPKDRFNIDSFYHPDGSCPGRTNARHGYFLNDKLRNFDASFFNIQPVEAMSMDPQQRLLLETTFEALSSAGLRLQELKGSDTAVFVGLMTHDFEVTKYHDLQTTGTYLVTGAAASIISNRLSYFFDWHGPSMTIDTACSSSLVAVHEAVQQLRRGYSTVAVAAGANLIMSPVSYVSESKLSMLSPTGRSRMWDSDADGYARGEGICSIVLKTLSQALKDGDSIECIIRETGVNQDGRTTGITMPSHLAQEKLIRETYARAGLDISKPEDRCQFFEAHGTGTPAGDPQEAEAIASAFFGGRAIVNEEPLAVGSVKTIIGHTEGTAGLAGLLKASLAVKHGIIPPNLLFKSLNPRIAPFYQNLRIPREPQSWPAIEPGQPRRASVNSFGFGGTNAHIIVEEFKSSDKQGERSETIGDSTHGLPVVFSAKTKTSLKESMERMLAFIKENSSLDVLDLAFTLLRNRSILPLRYSISGRTKESITAALSLAVRDFKATAGSDSITAGGNKVSILGIFTGQGAQFPGMMKGLFTAVPYVQEIIAELDHSLQTLPLKYRPSWTLHEQFSLDETSSNILKAAYSQPICCATQIVLVQMLAAAGIKFTTVVGHSSGEIACAYATGLISASQAIRVAHLRGLASQFAGSDRGEGAMLAAGVSFEDAQELCELEAFEGCICIAASNAPDSTTIAGDKESILQVQGILEDESKFNRLLKVDKAYHSHHMQACATPYKDALVACGCAVADGVPETSVTWYSSVHTGVKMSVNDVTFNYWTENLLNPVMFMQALEEAAMEHQPNVAVEVGCHPALKAPSISTLKGIGIDDFPYTGCMQRDSDDLTAFSEALGYLWQRFAILKPVDVDKYISMVCGIKPKNISKMLPMYPWDHSKIYWSESRTVSNFLHGPRPHILLGSPTAFSTPSVLQWRNFFRVKDHRWMQGHGLQGQALFPAAGFIIMAMEAGIIAAENRAVQLVEVLDTSIDKAIIFEDETSPAEVVTTAKILTDVSNPTRITLGFTIDSCLSKEAKLSTSAQGRVVVTFGPSSISVLPPVRVDHPHMNDLDIDYFYRELDALGYCYDGSYRCISEMRRADSKSAGTLPNFRLNDGPDQMVLHPATLDLSFQTIMGAYSHPGDKRLRSLYVPVHVDRIAVAFGVSRTAPVASDILHFSTANTYDKGDFFAGSVDTTDDSTDRIPIFSVENLVLKPLSPPTSSEDHRAFTTTFWGPLMPDKLLDDPELWATEEDKRIMPIIERIVYSYIKKFLIDLTVEDRENATGPQKSYIHWYDHVMANVAAGQHRWYDECWENDTPEYIEQLCQENWYHPHVRLAHRVNQNALSTIRENSNPFSWMNEDGLLTEFYTSRKSTGPGWGYGKQIVHQIAHRFQSMDILEVGGGTAGATRSILSIPQLGFNSYTFTDISPAFFEKARHEFTAHQDRMDFQKLDISQSPDVQGFQAHSYDLVLASSVLHATPNLDETMKNVRYLLRPGGYVVILEATHRDHTRVGYLFGLFPDWWAGRDEGRILDPFATIDEWDAIFKRNGFSGVECRTLDRDGHIFPNSLFITRAVTSKVTRLYEPLTVAPELQTSPPLVIVGGMTLKSSRILQAVNSILTHRNSVQITTLKDVRDKTFDYRPTFLVLSEFDEELFSDIDEPKLESVKSMFAQASNVLWITENAWTARPHQAMTIGFLRTARNEYPEISIQAFDVGNADVIDPVILCEQLLRLEEWACPSSPSEDVLWTYEPEIYLCEGRLLVPRVKHDSPRNERMASARRNIYSNVFTDSSPVILELPYKDLQMASLNNDHLDVNADHLVILAQYSLIKAVRVANLGYLYLILGSVKGEERTVVALSHTNASIVTVPLSMVFDLPKTCQATKDLLPQLAASLFMLSIASDLIEGTSVVIFEPPMRAIAALSRVAAKHQFVSIHVVSTQSEPMSTNLLGFTWKKVHFNESVTGLRDLLPSHASVLYDLSNDQYLEPLSRRMVSHFPSSCVIFRLNHFFQDCSSSRVYQEHLADEQTKLGAERILAALEDVASDIPHFQSASKSLMVDHTSLQSVREMDFDILTTMNWKTDGPVAARIRPIDEGDLFAMNKTYLLVGLAGSTGRSLARWMVTKGARYVVLSSRNPQSPDHKWIEEIVRLGGHITVLPMDVSKKASLDAGLAQLRQNLPPIGGIVYGPLVLHDTILRNMDISMMRPVLNAKVTGAKLLHEHFSSPVDNPLDFFVMCSSAATTGGNPGQANYNAANAFLLAFAQKRRLMGLAASTIHIGAVMGIGYLATREEKFDLQSVSDMDPLGEAEFCTLVAEAVISGRTSSTPCDEDTSLTTISEIDIGTGIPELHHRFKDTLVFYTDPRFGNLKVPERRATTHSSSKTSVKEQLLVAKTLDEVRQAIINGLCERLRSTLHLSDGEQIDPGSPLIDQGVDSLGAITVASWFSNQLTLDVPILKVLGGASVAELAEESSRRLASSAIPQVAGIADNATDSGSVSSNNLSEPGTGAETPLSIPTPGDEDPATYRRAPLSLIQERSWRMQQQLADDPTIFHNTIGLLLQGNLDLNKLSRAVLASLNRHEVFRTAIRGSAADGEAAQVVLKAPTTCFRPVEVADQSAAESALEQLRAEKYDLDAGEALKVVDFHWGPDRHLFVIAYHRLTGDGSTTDNFFVELAQLYDGAKLPQPPQYADFAIRQRLDKKNGRLDMDIAYWKDVYASMPPVLPLLQLPHAKKQRLEVLTWQQHTATLRLNSTVAQRVKEASRRLKATPMHFYLAAYSTLLATLADQEDLVVGLADTNRSSIDDVSTMGFFANMLPIRMNHPGSARFEDFISETKNRVRKTMLHSAVPYGVLLEELGLGGPDAPSARQMTHEPLVQAVFDYRQGERADSGKLGAASIVKVLATRERTAHDVCLEIADDPSRSLLLTAKMQSSCYGLQDPKVFLKMFESMLRTLTSKLAT